MQCCHVVDGVSGERRVRAGGGGCGLSDCAGGQTVRSIVAEDDVDAYASAPPPLPTVR